MNTAQVTACQPGICVKNISQLHMLRSRPCVLPKSFDPCSRVLLTLRAEQSFGLKCRPVSHSRKPLHICFAGEGMMGNNDENSPWKAIEKTMENFKGQSIEDVLRKQIEKGEYYDSGGGDGVEPPGGGGSGSGGSPDGSSGPEDENFFEENLQVFLATLGLLFTYIYILTGKELTRLAKDYIRYLFGGSQSVRLRNVMDRWEQFYESLTAKEEEEDEYWLEKAILYTPTWFQDPDTYGDGLRNFVRSNPDVATRIREELELDSDEDAADYLESDDDGDEDEDEYEDEE